MEAAYPASRDSKVIDGADEIVCDREAWIPEDDDYLAPDPQSVSDTVASAQTSVNAGRHSAIAAGPYRVREGESMSSIAFRAGFAEETLWNHSDNAALKHKRKDPHVLMAGDTVEVPERQRKEAQGATEQKHRFRRKDVPNRKQNH